MALSDDAIIAMARDANPEHDLTSMLPFLSRFAALVAAKEREACAQIAQATVCDTHIPTGIRIYGTKAAQAIRARSKP